jgi:hypothetical protein
VLDLIDDLRKYLRVERKGKRIDRELRKAEKHPEPLSAARDVAKCVAEAIADRKKQSNPDPGNTRSMHQAPAL